MDQGDVEKALDERPSRYSKAVQRTAGSHGVAEAAHAAKPSPADLSRERSPSKRLRADTW
jgi:hypothetical protein